MVRPTERLNQAVHLQILVHTQRVQRGGVKAGEEHINHNEQAIQGFPLDGLVFKYYTMVDMRQRY